MSTSKRAQVKRKPARRKPPVPTNLEPWERQPGEGDKRYAAFLIYRDQPANGILRRSLEKAARTCGLSPRMTEQWSYEDHWRDRCAAWDRHVQSVRQAATERRLEELGETQANQIAAAAAALSQPVVAFLQKLQESRQRGIDPYGDVSLHDLELQAIRASRALPRVIGAQRLVAGLSTENVDMRGRMDVQVAEARRQAEQMPRAEQERLLLGEGLVDGREVEREGLS